MPETPSNQTAASSTLRRWRADRPLPGDVQPVEAGEESGVKQRKLFVMLTFAFILIGALAGLVYWLRPIPRPRFVPVSITEYESRLIPPIPYSIRDAEALRTYFPNLSQLAPLAQDGHQVLSELGALAERSSSETVVIFLSAYASVTDQGEATLAVADTRPDDPRSRLPLRDVLELVRSCPARRKLVVLDLGRPLSDPRLGVLRTDTPAQLLHVLDSIPDPDRLALLTCAPGQITHGSEVLGRSVFSYYFEQALQGYADGYGTSRQDGQVSVREVAQFVRARVDRWVATNRGVRQTPMLVGTGGDFPLVALSHSRPAPKLELPASAAYPLWLQNGWKLRDQWAAEEVQRLTPSLFRRLEASLLHAEAEWRQGQPLTRVVQNLNFQIERFTDRLTRVRREVAEPEPHSLALARAQGEKIDPALVDAVKELLTTVEGETRELKPDKAAEAQARIIAEFLGKQKPKTHFQLAWAVMQQISAQSSLGPEAIRTLQSVLSASQSRPAYEETQMLHEMAELARQTDVRSWPAARARRMIEATLLGEQAASQVAAFPWLRHDLDVAVQRRHDGAAVFWSRGFASPALADERLREALRGYEALIVQGNTLERARGSLDDAGVLLPAITTYLEQRPRHDQAWISAAEAATTLHTLLGVPPTDRMPPGDLQRLLDQARQQTDILDAAVSELRRPFRSDTVAALTRQSLRQDADAAMLAEMEAILSTPFLTSEDRSSLWKSARSLGARLHHVVTSLDDDDDASETPTPITEEAPADLARLERLAIDEAARRARWSIALLRLGGLAEADRPPLEALLTSAGADTNERGAKMTSLATRLREAWAERVPAQLQEETNPSRRGRLAQVVSPADTGVLRDDMESKLWIDRRLADRLPYWSWLAERYRYLTRDPLFVPPDPGPTPARLPAVPFYVLIAQRYLQRTTPEPELYIELGGEASLSTPPSLEAGVGYRIEGRSHELQRESATTKPSKRSPDQVQVAWLLADDDWLRITPADVQAALGSGSSLMLPMTDSVFAAPLHIALRPGAERRGSPRPRGFLLEATFQGRTYHRRVDLPSLPSSEPAEILLSADPKNAAAPLGDLRLRPRKTPQPVYLFVRNDALRARKVSIQLSAPGLPTTGVMVELKPEEQRRIDFPPLPPLSPAAGGASAVPTAFELSGPLTIRVAEAETGTVVGRRQILVSVALPSDYISVNSIQFAPPGPNPGDRNRLLIRLRPLAPLGTLPCLVELVLPAKRVPGLLGLKDGVLQGELPSDGGELQLWAEDLQFLPGTDEDGYVYLTIDGRERAVVFRTTFARSGAATTPRPDYQTDLRIRATRYIPTNATLQIDVETDNPPAGASLEVALGDGRDDNFRAAIEQKVTEALRRRVALNPAGPGGALLFEAAIQQDWSISLDGGRLLGRHTVRVRLIDKDGNPLKTIYQDVVLDDSPPERVQFIELGRKVPRDVPFILRASGSDPASGIGEVNFYIGKPLDGKLPPSLSPIAAQPTDGQKRLWTARIPLTPDQKGPMDLIAIFTNGVGLTAMKTVTIEIVETDPAKSVPGSVEGKLMEGSRPQGKLRVLLTDTKGVSREATTKEDGSFLFEGVAPGRHRVSSAKTVPAKIAQKDLTIQPGRRTSVTLELFLK